MLKKGLVLRKALFVFLALLLSAVPVCAEVLSSQRVQVCEVRIYLSQPELYPQVVTHFGPGNMRFLERLDMVVNKQGEIIGICLLYRLGDGFWRTTFLRKVRGWMIRYPRDGSLSKEVTIRVVTLEETVKF